MASSTKVRKRAKQLKGRPVRVTLRDGRSYVGWITGLEKQGLILSTQRRNKKSKRKPPSRSQKATVSGLLPLLGSLFGNMGVGATGATSAGASGFWGYVTRISFRNRIYVKSAIFFSHPRRR